MRTWFSAVRESGAANAAKGPGQWYRTDYSDPDNLTALNAATIISVGGNQSHLNLQPFLTLKFSIALQGICPLQT